MSPGGPAAAVRGLSARAQASSRAQHQRAELAVGGEGGVHHRVGCRDRRLVGAAQHPHLITHRGVLVQHPQRVVTRLGDAKGQNSTTSTGRHRSSVASMPRMARWSVPWVSVFTTSTRAVEPDDVVQADGGHVDRLHLRHRARLSPVFQGERLRPTRPERSEAAAATTSTFVTPLAARLARRRMTLAGDASTAITFPPGPTDLASSRVMQPTQAPTSTNVNPRRQQGRTASGPRSGETSSSA